MNFDLPNPPALRFGNQFDLKSLQEWSVSLRFHSDNLSKQLADALDPLSKLFSQNLLKLPGIELQLSELSSELKRVKESYRSLNEVSNLGDEYQCLEDTVSHLNRIIVVDRQLREISAMSWNSGARRIGQLETELFSLLAFFRQTPLEQCLDSLSGLLYVIRMRFLVDAQAHVRQSCLLKEDDPPTNTLSFSFLSGESRDNWNCFTFLMKDQKKVFQMLEELFNGRFMVFVQKSLCFSKGKVFLELIENKDCIVMRANILENDVFRSDELKEKEMGLEKILEFLRRFLVDRGIMEIGNAERLFLNGICGSLVSCCGFSKNVKKIFSKVFFSNQTEPGNTKPPTGMDEDDIVILERIRKFLIDPQLIDLIEEVQWTSKGRESRIKISRRIHLALACVPRNISLVFARMILLLCRNITKTEIKNRNICMFSPNEVLVRFNDLIFACLFISEKLSAPLVDESKTDLTTSDNFSKFLSQILLTRNQANSLLELFVDTHKNNLLELVKTTSVEILLEKFLSPVRAILSCWKFQMEEHKSDNIDFFLTSDSLVSLSERLLSKPVYLLLHALPVNRQASEISCSIFYEILSLMGHLRPLKNRKDRIKNENLNNQDEEEDLSLWEILDGLEIYTVLLTSSISGIVEFMASRKNKKKTEDYLIPALSQELIVRILNNNSLVSSRPMQRDFLLSKIKGKNH